MEQNIIDKIIAVKDIMPKKQKQLCNFIVLNSQEAGMLTVAEIAERAGVGTTTVMRLMQYFEYESYNAFRRDLLSASMQQRNSTYGNRKRAFISARGEFEGNTLAMISDDVIKSIENFNTPKNMEQFNKAVEIMLNAENINVLGLRSSTSPALYFEYAVSIYYHKIVQLSNSQEFLFDKILQIKPNDVLLVISQWPCTKKTIDAAKAAHKRGIPIVLITNTILNPLAPIADAVIDTNSVSNNSYIIPISVVIEALAYEIGKRTADESTKNVEELEQMLKENDLIIWNDK